VGGAPCKPKNGGFWTLSLPSMPGVEFPTIFMGGNSMLGEASETSDADLEVPSQPWAIGQRS
jgi:hypothetical protein